MAISKWDFDHWIKRQHEKMCERAGLEELAKIDINLLQEIRIEMEKTRNLILQKLQIIEPEVRHLNDCFREIYKLATGRKYK